MLTKLGRYLAPLQGPSGPQPALAFNFLTMTALPSELAFLRSSNALMLDPDGFFTQRTNDTPRFLTNVLVQGAAGILIEPQATAKNHYARPSAGTLAQHFSSTPAQLSIVTDTTNPGKNLGTGTQVWQIANNTGSPVTVSFQGTTGSTLTHNIQIWTKTISGSGGSVSLSGIGSVAFSNAGWAQTNSEGLTPPATTNQLQVTANANATILFTCANLQFAQEGTASRYSTHNTSLIDSAGAQTTRAADRLHLSAMAPWFNAAEGTFVVQYEDPRLGTSNTQSRRLLQFDATTSSNDRIVIQQSNTTSKRFNVVISDNGVSSVNENHTFTGTYGPVVKMALGYKANDAAFAWQNILRFTDTTVTLPDQISNLGLGYDRVSQASQINACLQKFAYYNTRLSNSVLQGLTR